MALVEEFSKSGEELHLTKHTCREYSGNIQGTCRKHAGNMQGTCREHTHLTRALHKVGDLVHELLHIHHLQDKQDTRHERQDMGHEKWTQNIRVPLLRYCSIGFVIRVVDSKHDGCHKQ
jgi:hypothetical protein